MTMQPKNHPDDERLAALAGADPEATGDSALSAHLATCDRCSEIVVDLRGLRAALAELPDLVPSRRLRLLPPVEDPTPAAADRLGGWVRRVFAPAMTAGAALALVGLIGTGLPSSSGDAGRLGVDRIAMPGEDEGAGGEPERALESEAAATDAASEFGPQSSAVGGVAGEADADGAEGGADSDSAEPKPNVFNYEEPEQTEEAEAVSGPPTDTGAIPLLAERSPWPMVLFSGVALMVGAVLLRWILAPRAP